MKASDYRSFLYLMWLGCVVMAVVIITGFVSGQWVVAFSGFFALGMLVFSSRAIYRPLRLLKRMGVPMDFFYEAQLLMKSGDMSSPKAFLIASRLQRRESFVRVLGLSAAPDGGSQRAEAFREFKGGLAWLEVGTYNMEEVAVLGGAYFDAIVSTAQREVDFTVVAGDVGGYADLVAAGLSVDDAEAYMAAVGPAAALFFLRDGVPLEYARVMVGGRDD